MFAILEAPSIAPDIRIECLRGSEALCRPYVFDMQLTVTGGELALAEAVGSAATLRLARDAEEPQLFHGPMRSTPTRTREPPRS